MKIWFDILTPKQVLFFRRAIECLRESGHQVLCTSRSYREAVELARLKNLEMTVVGSHGGAERYEKLRQSASRTLELTKVAGRFGPDVAITFSSPEAARVAFGLGMRHVGFNDSPHAESVARLTIPLMTRLYCPWIIPYSAWAGYGIARKKVVSYRALDPAAWLKHYDGPDHQADHNTILLRVEESKASYVVDKRLGTDDMIDELVRSLQNSAEIVVLCRYQDQIEKFESRYQNRVRVIKNVIDGALLVSSCQVFIGAGGTMTAEAALLGKPTISITPFDFYVEKYLLRTGLVRKAAKPKLLVKLARKMMTDEVYQKFQKKKAARILQSMEDPTDKIVSAATDVRI